MITRLALTNFKSFKHVDVPLGRLAVLFGPNASGKSNFLDAIQLLSSIASVARLDEAFAAPYRGTALLSVHMGDEGLAGLLKQANPGFAVEVDALIADALADEVMLVGSFVENKTVLNRRWLRYRLEIAVNAQTGRPAVVNERLTALDDHGRVRPRTRALLETDPEDSTKYLCRRENGGPKRLPRDPDVPLLAAASSYSSTPHLIALRWLLWSVCVYRLEPQQTMRRPEELQARMTVGPHGEHLTSVLNTMKQESPERFRNLERAVRAIVPDAEGLEPRINDRGELELWLREHGRDVPARLASDGTLRIIGLLSLSAGEKKHSIIGFEEPENGVHPARLRLLARMLETQMQAEDRQWIVTTHSPILPDLLPTGCLLTCRSRDGHTEVLPFTETEPGRRAAAIREELDPAGPSIEVLMQRGDLG